MLGGDCDDGDGANFPGNLEVCDAQDNDCDLSSDELVDFDGDGFSVCGASGDGSDGDCDDTRPSVNPNGQEVCDTLDRDEDCDGLSDEADPDAAGCQWEQVDTGFWDDYSCGLAPDGEVTCWGVLDLEPDSCFDDYGNITTTVPQGPFSQITTGMHHACALRTDGTVSCWGTNFFNQNTPPLGTFTAISSGNNHNCGITTTGSITCWGQEINGEVSDVPLDANGATRTDWEQVSAGSYFTCALDSSAAITCWGTNTSYQCDVPPGSYRQVTAGLGFACGLTTADTAVCWGTGNAPPSPPATDTFLQIDAGAHALCGVRSDGSVACWSYGTGSGGAGSEPTAGTFLHVATGRKHSCALRNDNSIVCWGQNDCGQLDVP
jgi:alpha-tubulin suppressor-like RCC1 family protein